MRCVDRHPCVGSVWHSADSTWRCAVDSTWRCAVATNARHECDRRVSITAPPDQPVEIEITYPEGSTPMGRGLTNLDDFTSVRRLIVPPGGAVYVLGVGTATLAAR